MGQTRMIPGEEPDDLIGRANVEHDPIATLCLFSGGHDSIVLAHRCREHYGELAFIDTGTAVPGVRDFVVSFARWLDKPLRIMESGDAFRRMVLDSPPRGGEPYGFPGPAQHGAAYVRLKERQIDALLRDLKVGQGRRSRVLFLTGVRRSESARRSQRPSITRRGSAVFANPLIDWTDAEMRAYRREFELPESDVAALLHRSGECNCGSFAAPGERKMLRAFYPDWFEQTIASLEREAEARGIPACRWGARPHERGPTNSGALCSDCQLRLIEV